MTGKPTRPAARPMREPPPLPPRCSAACAGGGAPSPALAASAGAASRALAAASGGPGSAQEEAAAGGWGDAQVAAAADLGGVQEAAAAGSRSLAQAAEPDGAQEVAAAGGLSDAQVALAAEPDGTQSLAQEAAAAAAAGPSGTGGTPAPARTAPAPASGRPSPSRAKVVGAGPGTQRGRAGREKSSPRRGDCARSPGGRGSTAVGDSSCPGEAAARRAWKDATGHEWKTREEGAVRTGVQPWIDDNTSFLLKIKLLGNPKKARKEVTCFSIEKIVDSDMTNIKDLLESIEVEYPPGYLEVAHIQYYDDVMRTFPKVKSDQDLMLMFSKHIKAKVITMFIVCSDASMEYEPITEWEFDDEIQQNKHLDKDDNNYLRNPMPHNEHVGVDEEGMYLDNEHTNPLPIVALSDKATDKEDIPDDDSEDGTEEESEDEMDVEVEEDEELVGHEATHIPNVEYDKEDPPMTEGSTYRTMDEFKLALCMHAVKNEFEFKTNKSSPYRFRAYCSRKRLERGAKWLCHLALQWPQEAKEG